MLQNIYEVKITGKDIKSFVKKIYKNKIFIEHLVFCDKSAYLKLDKENYERLKKIKTIYKIELVRVYGVIKIVNLIKVHSFFIVSLIIGLCYLIFLSNIIFKVDIIHSDNNIRNLLYKELEDCNIKKYSFVKSYNEKEKIKQKILEKHKDKLEWLEINRVGTKYEIRVEERIINKKTEEKKANHIIAKKDGIIKKIISSKGEILKRVNDYVKEGDVLISGFITKNDTIKNKVSAAGEVYAEVWYKTSISMPFYYKEEIEIKNKKKTFKIKFINKDLYILNFDKYKTYKSDNIISLKNKLLPIELIFEEQIQTNLKENIFSKKEALEEAKKRSDEKIRNSLKKDEKILKSKIISTMEFENYINVVIFYKVYEKISLEKIITEDDVNKFKTNNSRD